MPSQRSCKKVLLLAQCMYMSRTRMDACRYGIMSPGSGKQTPLTLDMGTMWVVYALELVCTVAMLVNAGTLDGIAEDHFQSHTTLSIPQIAHEKRNIQEVLTITYVVGTLNLISGFILGYVFRILAREVTHEYEKIEDSPPCKHLRLHPVSPGTWPAIRKSLWILFAGLGYLLIF